MILLATVFRRRFREWAAYPVQAVAEIVALYVIFLIIFFGAKAIGGASVTTGGETLSAIAVGYVVFFLTMQSYQQFQQGIRSESEAGTLEQLALSRYGLLSVLLSDALAFVAITTAMFALVLVPIMATTGRWLHFDVPSVLAVLIPTMAGVTGLGLGMGGMALVFKRVQGVASFLQLGFLFLVAAPVDRFPLFKLLPVAHGNYLLRTVLVDERSAFVRPDELLILCGVSFVYFAAGVLIFRAMDRQARDRALLGQY